LSAQWHQPSSDSLKRASGALLRAWAVLTQPQHLSRIRRGCVYVLVFWAIFAIAKLIWLVVPDSSAAIPSGAVILNPVENSAGSTAAKPVDIKELQNLHLFGVAGSGGTATATAVVEDIKTNSDRDGIEDGAKVSRLDLKLRGVISVSEDGLGHAMIEHKARQEGYAVGDELPVGKGIILAKVMPHGVVLDNRGTYELLRLFEEFSLLGQIPDRSSAPSPPPRKVGPSAAREISVDGNSAVVAQSIRRQLYDDPQSLAEVVRVSAVRENNTLKGYRVDPGKSGAQFTQLGFESGDVVISVNGINLDNPANTMALYQLMRSASEAVFDVERGTEILTLTVDLNGAADGG
jgi:general secretion pathway protein C